MARTERPKWLDSAAPATNQTVYGTLLSEDVRAFERLAQSLRPQDREWALQFWHSVPYPMQTLGRDYKAWSEAKSVTAPKEILIRREDRAARKPPERWAHPRFRALMDILEMRDLSLPWLRPSLPWWPLQEPWAEAPGKIDGKLLVFSRFRAAPGALAALLSFAIESRLLPGRSSGGYDAPHSDYLPAAADRPGVLELFHPSPVLAKLEPLEGYKGSLLGAKAKIAGALRKRLESIGVRVVAHVDRPLRRSWELLAAIERRWPEPLNSSR